MPAGHPEPVLLEHPGELGQRLDPAAVDLLDPAGQVLLGSVGIVELVERLEPQPKLVGADGVQRLLEQLIEPVLLALGQVRRALEPQVARALQQPGVVLGLDAADLVDRLGEVRADVVAIKRDLRRRQVLSVPARYASDMSWQTSLTWSPRPPWVSRN